MKIIINSQLNIKLDSLQVDEIDLIKESNTYPNPEYVSAIQQGFRAYHIDKTISTYEIEDNFIIVPRGYLAELSDYQLIDKTTLSPVTIPKLKDIVLRDYQVKAVADSMRHDQGIIQAGTGCVDGDTEYFTGNGWKPIKYYEGGKVGQWNKETKFLEMVQPDDYIKKPVDNLFRVKTKYGLDMCLSPEHRFAYYTESNNLLIKSFTDVMKSHKKNAKGFSGKIPTSFKYSGAGYPLSNEALRVQVAVIADGYFQSTATRTVIFRLKKERKKEKLRELLKNAEITYKERECQSVEGFSIFSFYSPIERLKVFDSNFYNCTKEQLKIISDEVVWWDGDQKKRFFTANKMSADFVQFAFTASGFRASLITTDRTHINGHNSLEHVVHRTARTGITMMSFNTASKIKIVRYMDHDGYKYCFSVPSGLLVLRRNGNIFITGNSGKTIIGLELIHQRQQETLILTHSKELMTQWQGEIKKLLGFECGLIGGGKSKQADITICMLQTLNKRPELLKELSESYGLVMVDEAHHIPSKTFAKVINQLACKYRYGLTATPHRRDGLHQLINRHVGGIIAEVSDEEVNQVGGVVPITIKQIDTNCFYEVTSWQEYIKAITEDMSRNQLIVDIAVKASSTVSTLILTDRVEHAETLSSMAKSSLLIHGQLPAKIRQERMKEISNHSLAIGTTGLLGEGLDISGWTALILATPISSRVKLLQAVGRVMRTHKGKQAGYVADLVDQCGFSVSSYRKRLEIYNEKGFNLI